MTNEIPKPKPRVQASCVRFRVDPGDIPPEKVARRLHLTPAEFREQLPRLLARNFPPPDPTTGNFDLDAIDRWRRLRHPRLFPELTGAAPVDDLEARRSSMGERFRATQERQRQEGRTGRKRRLSSPT